MVAEDKGRRHGEGHIDHLPAAVHVLHHAEHGNDIGQTGHHPGGGDVVHAQQPAQLQKRLAENLGDHVDQGEGSRQHEADLSYYLDPLGQRGHTWNEGHAGKLGEHRRGKADGNDRQHALAEAEKAPDHGLFKSPEAQSDEGGEEDDGHQIPQEHTDGKARRQAAEKGADGDGDHARQNALCQGRTILLPDDAQGHGNDEHHRGAQHGADDEAAELGCFLRLRQLIGQGCAAHVVGQDGPGEHGRIRPQKAVDRHQNGL